MSILPLLGGGGEGQHGVMDTDVVTARRPDARDHLIVQATPHGNLALVPRRRRDRLLARMLAWRLDARLARGVPAETSRVLAARASWLTSPEHRSELADGWDLVLERARGTSALLDPRVPVDRAAVLAAASQIGALASVLRSAVPVGAGEIARVQALLTDGAGPVYVGGALRSLVETLVDDLVHGRADQPPAVS